MKIQEILNTGSIKVGLEVKNKKELLDEMVKLAVNSGKINNPGDARKEIFEREKIMSTGVGKGIALPHAKTNAVEDSIGAFALLTTPVDYDSLDSEPVNLVFLLLGRENNVGNHLRLLSKISRIMNNDALKLELMQQKTPDGVLEVFKKIESQ
ncbi:MAG: PTS sugar transporter subunit IIA [Candidatus Kapaibacterium sp.]